MEAAASCIQDNLSVVLPNKQPDFLPVGGTNSVMQFVLHGHT